MMKKFYLILLTLFVHLFSFSQTWLEVDDASSGNGVNHSMDFAPDGTPYVFYSDFNKGYDGTVIKFNGTSWDTVGSPGFTKLVSSSQVTYTDILVKNHNEIFVSYATIANHKISVMKYDGTSWSYVGASEFSAPNSYYTSMDTMTNGTLCVAYSDGSQSGRATVMYFDGTSWQPIDYQGFSTVSVSKVQLKIDDFDNFWVMLIDNSAYPVCYYYYLGGTWTTYGALFMQVGLGQLDFELHNNTLYFAHQTITGGKISLLYHTGSGWSNYLPDITGSGGQIELEFDNFGQPLITYSDGSTSGIRAKWYNGVQWVDKGLSTISAVSSDLKFDRTTNTPYLVTPKVVGTYKNHIRKYSCNSYSSVDSTLCSSLTSPSGKYTWTSTGIYLDTIQNANLCDSVITFNLTFINALYDTSYHYGCSEYTSPLGSVYNTSGTYYDTLIGNGGACDTILVQYVTIELEKISPVLTNDSICFGDSSSLTILSSLLGANYKLKELNTNTVVKQDTGNGGVLSFNLQPTSSTDYIVEASYEGLVDTSHVGIEFNSASQQSLLIPATNNFGLQGQYTFEAWIYPRSANYDRIMSSWNQGSSAQFLFDTYSAINNGRALRFAVGSNSSNTIVTSPNNVLTLNTWNHVAVTYGGSLMNMYVNGNLVHSELKTGLTIPYTLSINWSVGHDPSGPNSFEAFDGYMDEIRVWNKTKTQTEIQQQMDTCLNGNETNLVLYYNFEDINVPSDTIHDKSINARHAVCTNITNSMSNLVTGRSIYCENATCSAVITDTLSLFVDSIDLTVTLSGSTLLAAQAGAQYRWLDCNNAYAPIAGETNQSFNFTTSGLYAVEITSDVCVDTSACVNVNTTEIKTNFNDIRLYPNPAFNQIFIDGINTSTKAEIMDITGRILKSELISNHTVNIEELPKGTYFIKLNFGDKIVTKSFQKK